MTTTGAIIPLIISYKKPHVRVDLINPNSPKERVEVDLPPVLYHGTAGICVDIWYEKNWIERHSLSLASIPTAAAQYASYDVDMVGEPESYDFSEVDLPWFVVVQNFYNRRARIMAKELGALSARVRENYLALARGEVVNSLVLFDRDLLLGMYNASNKVKARHDEGDGVCFEVDMNAFRSGFSFPFFAVIACLDVNVSRQSFAWRIFNRELWDENFSEEPFSLDRVKLRVPLTQEFGAMFLSDDILTGSRKVVEIIED
ncbi:MAG: hypothetical protein HQ564_02530 [Candidatus Saganbacteria bacterium]|nr:hypothetical protein [Candidatus Saganbacteria bacterium]